jgi:hypothetical protein
MVRDRGSGMGCWIGVGIRFGCGHGRRFRHRFWSQFSSHGTMIGFLEMKKMRV